MDTDLQQFADLLAAAYGWYGCTLVPLSGQPGATSRAFLATRPDGEEGVLHAYGAAWIDWIGPRQTWPGRVIAYANLLHDLAAHQYPAPRVVPALDGASVVTRDRWALLLTDYVAGATHDYTAPGLHALGAVVGHLHTLPLAPPSESWWSLTSVVPRVAARLAEVAATVPEPWREWHDTCLRELLAWGKRTTLPTATIHADAWTGNAVIAADGGATLIDWELAGAGPVILDFGSLILHGHYDLPGNRPDTARIAAIVTSYQGFRQPTAAEFAVLTEAIRFGPCYRSALFLIMAADGPWRDQIAIERDRYPAAPALAAATLACLAGTP